MPGNETLIRSARTFFPPIWLQSNIPAGQVIALPMSMAGIPLITSLPVPRETSIVSAGIVLSSAVTAEFIRFEITIDGALTGKNFDMTPAQGTKAIKEFEPGTIVLSKGQELGVSWGSHPGLLPDGTIEAIVIFEVQFS